VALSLCRGGLLFLGTAPVFLAGQGGGVVLLPYAFTRWQPGTPPWPVVVRAIGVALIAVGGIMVLTGFVRFATEGIGIPFPAEPTSRQLTIGGPYRYVRNPVSRDCPGCHRAGTALQPPGCCWPTRRCCSPPSSRSPTGTRNRHWPGASANNTRPTASRCPGGGRACPAERHDITSQGCSNPLSRRSPTRTGKS
jgi:hypothetical protein